MEEAKEKLGMLRAYFNRSGGGLDALVLAAERASARMCQVCGGEAILSRSPDPTYRIYATLCDAHRGDSIPAAQDPVMLSMTIAPDGTVHEVKRR